MNSDIILYSVVKFEKRYYCSTSYLFFNYLLIKMKTEILEKKNKQKKKRTKIKTKEDFVKTDDKHYKPKIVLNTTFIITKIR